jgi:hypothetical protein
MQAGTSLGERVVGGAVGESVSRRRMEGDHFEY